MKRYCCHVLNQDGRVSARETLESSNDNEAFGCANGYLAQNPSARAVEIWLEGRYVGKLHQPVVLGSLPVAAFSSRLSA